MRKKFILFNFLIIALALAALFAFGVSASRESHFNEAEKKLTKLQEFTSITIRKKLKTILKKIRRKTFALP